MFKIRLESIREENENENEKKVVVRTNDEERYNMETASHAPGAMLWTLEPGLPVSTGVGSSSTEVLYSSTLVSYRSTVVCVMRGPRSTDDMFLT